MDAKVHVRGDVAVIQLSGRICLCGEDLLRPLVARLLERGFQKFLLDLRRAHYIDSATLGGMVRAYTVASRKGGQLKLLNVQKRLRDLLEMTRLTGAFEQFDSEDQAVESYGGSVSAVS